MSMKAQLTSLLAGVTLIGVGASSTLANDGPNKPEVVRARLGGFQEVPALSTPAKGRFRAVIDEDAGTIEYTLSYQDLGSPVAQAHVHFGQRGVNGGISFFLCTNLGNGPPGTQTCPAAPAEISGTITSVEVVGPNTQGIDPGEFAEIVAAIRAGIAYANVHSETFGGGEVRGQIRIVD
jgi:CHRD domain